MSWDIIWQPGHLAEESVTPKAGGIRDGWETGSHGDLTILDKLVTFDLQQLFSDEC